MSKKNGDKARFGRERKKKNLRRKRIRALSEKLLRIKSGSKPKSISASQSGLRD